MFLMYCTVHYCVCVSSRKKVVRPSPLGYVPEPPPKGVTSQARGSSRPSSSLIEAKRLLLRLGISTGKKKKKKCKFQFNQRGVFYESELIKLIGVYMRRPKK